MSDEKEHIAQEMWRASRMLFHPNASPDHIDLFFMEETRDRLDLAISDAKKLQS